MQNHEQFIRRCLDLARKGEYYVAPNPMVGAVLVDEKGEILAEGWHQQYGGPHAEVNCFRQLDLLPTTYYLRPTTYDLRPTTYDLRPTTYDLRPTTLYVSLEPCSHYGKTPPCAKMIIERGVGHVVVGTLDPNPLVAGRGVEMLREAGIEVTVGVLEEECRYLNRRFFTFFEKHRPYIILKWAQTEDGFIADLSPTDGSQQRLVLSSPLTKQLVHRMRAENMAIMVGTNTVIADNPRLLTTHWQGRNPIRITIDRHHRIPSDSRIFSQEAETIVFRDDLSWQQMLEQMWDRKIHSVLVEGGTQLLNMIIESGIYDEVHVEVAPVKIQGKGVKAPHIALPPKPNMEIDGHLIYEM